MSLQWRPDAGPEAIGVFVGYDALHDLESKYNMSCIIDSNAAPTSNGSGYDAPRPTNQRAELQAGIRGLRQALKIQKRRIHVDMGSIFGGEWWEDLSRVIIKSDSSYMVKGLTDSIRKWRLKGYTNSRGSKVVNHELFEEADGLITDLNDVGVWVQFWLVKRHENAEADALANQALETEEREGDKELESDEDEDEYNRAGEYGSDDDGSEAFRWGMFCAASGIRPY